MFVCMKKYHATISADIIASTSLDSKEIATLTLYIQQLLQHIEEYLSGKDRIYSRLILGDYIECLINKPKDALRVALILKTGIKSFHLEKKTERVSANRKLFQSYGIRVAIGIGQMNTELIEKDILNGDAISRSGRLIAEQRTSNKEKIVIKNTLFIDSPNAVLNNTFTVILGLMDELLNKATGKQSEIIFLKLFGLNEEEISRKLNIGQSSVNQQSRAAGWNAIEQAVKYYESYNFRLK